MAFARLFVLLATFAFGLLAFRARLAEARAVAGSAAESLFVLRGSWQRVLPVLALAAVGLTAVRGGLGIALSLLWAIVTVPLIVAALVRVIVFARDGIVVAGRKHLWSDFAGFLEDEERRRVVLVGITPEAERVELPASRTRRVQLLAALRRRLPEIAGRFAG